MKYRQLKRQKALWVFRMHKLFRTRSYVNYSALANLFTWEQREERKEAIRCQ